MGTLPVAQGFMVEVVGSGNIEFNNGQRLFKTEASGDTMFFRQGSSSERTDNNSDNAISLVRLKFTQDNGLGRELVLGFSNITNDDFDYGYDAKANNVI